MTGLDFCMKVNEFIELIGEKKKDIHLARWYAILFMLILMYKLLLLYYFTPSVPKYLSFSLPEK